jgi:hypothetical protein
MLVIHSSLLSLVFKASLCARFEVGQRDAASEALCLLARLILRASGPEQHKVKNEVFF